MFLIVIFCSITVKMMKSPSAVIIFTFYCLQYIHFYVRALSKKIIFKMNQGIFPLLGIGLEVILLMLILAMAHERANAHRVLIITASKSLSWEVMSLLGLYVKER